MTTISYRCPHCNCSTDAKNPRLKEAGIKGVTYYCDCEVCLNTTTVTTSPHMLHLTGLTKRLQVERFFLN